jgi:hypothetical protein
VQLDLKEVQALQEHKVSKDRLVLQGQLALKEVQESQA